MNPSVRLSYEFLTESIIKSETFRMKDVSASAGISREKDNSTDIESMLFNLVYKSCIPSLSSLTHIVLLIYFLSSFFPATPSSVHLKYYPKLDPIKNTANICSFYNQMSLIGLEYPNCNSYVMHDIEYSSLSRSNIFIS